MDNFGNDDTPGEWPFDTNLFNLIHLPSTSTIKLDSEGNPIQAPDSENDAFQALQNFLDPTEGYFDNPPLPEVGTYIPLIDGQTRPEYVAPSDAPFELTASAQTMLDQANQDPMDMQWFDLSMDTYDGSLLFYEPLDQIDPAQLSYEFIPDPPQDKADSIYPSIDEPQASSNSGPVPYHILPGYDTPSEEELETDELIRKKLRKNRKRRLRNATQKEITEGRMERPTKKMRLHYRTPEEDLKHKQALNERDKINRHKREARKKANGLIIDSPITDSPILTAQDTDEPELSESSSAGLQIPDGNRAQRKFSNLFGKFQTTYRPADPDKETPLPSFEETLGGWQLDGYDQQEEE